MRQYLYNIEKLKYAASGRHDHDCILCGIVNRDPDLSGLELYRSEYNVVTVNLYPYNPGHIMIFPIRHITSLDEMTEEEALDHFRILKASIRILNDEFSPHGYNIGYNMGDFSGASIGHLHQHIVPRFCNEIGFIDVLAGARISVVDPNKVMERLSEQYSRL